LKVCSLSIVVKRCAPLVTLQGDRLTALALLGAGLILAAVLAVELLPRRAGARGQAATA
jgi:hypothetical protein